MTKSQRMQPILKIAAQREQDASRALGASQRQLLEQQERLQQLQAYRVEYASRMHAQGAHGISASQIQGYQAFLARLDAGISEQEYVLMRAVADMEHKKDAWQSTHIRTQALDKVQVKYHQEETLVITKREQKDTDDYALRLFSSVLTD